MALLPGFVGPSYTSRSTKVDPQRTVNLYLEIDESGGGKDQQVASLVGTPGLSVFATIAGGPSRGQHVSSGGRVFGVSGNQFYEITNSSGAVTGRGAIGTASGRVSITDNGQQVIIVDGNRGYIFDLTANTLTAIADAEFPNGATHVAFLDGYFLANRADSIQCFFSASYDGTSWDGLDFFSKEGQADNVLALIADHGELLVLGAYTSEVFFDSGDVDNPFQRIQGAFIEHGIAAIGSLCQIDNSAFWLVQDRSGWAWIARLEGYQPKRVSTFAVERSIASFGDISGATAYTYQQNGHSFYNINFPTGNVTWSLDVASGQWHERSYTNPVSGAQERHRGDNHSFAFGKHLIGDYANGKLYELDDATYSDDSAPITRLRRFRGPDTEGKLAVIDSLEIQMETGDGPETGLLDGSGNPREPQAMLRVSRDGGATWGNEVVASLGAVGQFFRRVIFRRLGAGRNPVCEFKITDPVKTVLISAYCRSRTGSS